MAGRLDHFWWMCTLGYFGLLFGGCAVDGLLWAALGPTLADVLSKGYSGPTTSDYSLLDVLPTLVDVLWKGYSGRSVRTEVPSS